MKTRKEIKSGVEVVMTDRAGVATITVCIDDQKIKLCKVRGTNEFFTVGYSYNENYIVVYSKGCMINQIPLKIEAVYDMTNKKVVPVALKNKVIFEYMCISRKVIELAVILEYLNDGKLEIAEPDEVDEFVRYVTADNHNIKKEEVVRYILKQYPLLEKFTGFLNPLTVKEYRKIIDRIATDSLRFHIMPNILDEKYT